MKLSHLLVATLVAGLAFVSDASAANYGTTAGLLDPNYQVVITYSGLPAGTLFDQSSYGIDGTTYTVTSHTTPTGSLTAAYSLDSSYKYTSLPPNTLPVLVTASITGTTGIATIKNLSPTAVNFFSFFTGVQGLSGITANAVISQVPLPPAFVLFASGLIALAGFSMYKKASNQA